MPPRQSRQVADPAATAPATTPAVTPAPAAGTAAPPKQGLGEHLCRVGTEEWDAEPTEKDVADRRRVIEPWFSALVQSEHLNLLVGNGLSMAVLGGAGVNPGGMTTRKFNEGLDALIQTEAERGAKACGRGSANIEDQIRAVNTLIGGLRVLADNRLEGLVRGRDEVLRAFVAEIIASERDYLTKLVAQDDKALAAQDLLNSFLMSFGSRAASRERLHIFTTNYDRIIEFACERLGVRILDRFVGLLRPMFRSSRIEVDFHYNPPGIRGEPRYLEGVVRLSKLHGSLDWRYEDEYVKKVPLPFGAAADHTEAGGNPESVMIYPNPAKDVETLEYPYADIFRDFSAAICRPNSSLVTYGYGFGDDHINRIISDMLTIPSTHLAIISYGDRDSRIANFIEKTGRSAQITLMIGSHFAGLETLVVNYLPKPAIDTISFRRSELLRRRFGGTQPQEQAPDANTADAAAQTPTA
jgi:hypothetical protein